MKNIVTFETAQRLKEAGFPQPNWSFGSFKVTFDESSMLISSIRFASSGESADFGDVAKHADRRVSDGNNTDVFGFDMSNQSDVNGIAFTGNGNYVVDFDTEKEIIEEQN